MLVSVAELGLESAAYMLPRAYLHYGGWMRMAGTAAPATDAFERCFIKGLISVAFTQAQEDPSLSVNMYLVRRPVSVLAEVLLF